MNQQTDKPMNVMYLRVSTNHQDVSNQRSGIEKYMQEHHMTIDRVIEEVVSGKVKGKDRKFASVMDDLKKGDTLIVSEVSRVGRNMMDVMSNLNTLCNEKGCNSIAVKQNYHFKPNDMGSNMMLIAYTISAEIERDLNSVRTREAIARLKANGRESWGRRSKLEDITIDPSLSIAEIAKQDGIQRRAVIHYVREHRKDLCYMKRNDYFAFASAC